MFEAHAYTYGGSSPRVGRRYFTEANRVKWFRKDRIIRVLVEQSEHTPLLPSLYLFPSLAPFPDYSVSISRTGVYPTVHPTLFSPFPVPRTIIPRFISHRQESRLRFRLYGTTTDQLSGRSTDSINFEPLVQRRRPVPITRGNLHTRDRRLGRQREYTGSDDREGEK